MTATIVRGLLRHILTIAGGYLVAQGTLTDGQAAEAVGALVALTGVGWSVWEKRRAGPAAAAHSERAPFTGTIVTIGIALIGLITLGAGCASVPKTVRADVEIQAGTNVFHVSQPKDTIIEKLEFDPSTGKFSLHGYQSTANAAAIEATRAQATAQAAVLTRMLEMFDRLSERAAVAYGGPAAAAVRSRSSPPAVSVRDDPSKPWVQLDLGPSP